MITKEKAIEILEFFDFFQGQRAGRELWAEKPYEVQEEDIAYFSERVSLLKEYIADVVPKSEVEELKQIYKRYNKAIKNERAEVAREIFAEIEKAIAKGFEYGTYFDVQRNIAELKKKYTEEQE